MADQTPAPEQTSYSDPVHDRVEAVLRFLARQWQLWVLACASIAIGVALWRYLDPGSADAAGASALVEANNAENRTAALVALSKNEGVPPEFRLRGAIGAATQLLQDGAIDEALAALDRGDAAAKALKAAVSGDEAKRNLQSLQAGLALTRSAVYERQGRLQEALDQVDPVAANARNYAAVDAGVRAALLRLALAEQAPATAAAELRRQAHDDLVIYKDHSEAYALAQVATWSYHELLRRHPELAGAATASARSKLDGGRP